MNCREVLVPLRIFVATYASLEMEPEMKEAVKRLNAEYGLNLTDEEMETIVRQAEAGRKLFQRLYETNVEGIVPAMKIDPAEKR
jgi:hypothetical protein